jgi:hypothetical protein
LAVSFQLALSEWQAFLCVAFPTPLSFALPYQKVKPFYFSQLLNFTLSLVSEFAGIGSSPSLFILVNASLKQ